MTVFKRWLEREDARRAERLKSGSVWWFVGETAVGLLLLLKAGGLVADATGWGSYGLALLLLAAGLAFLWDGVQGLRAVAKRPSKS